MNLKLPETRAGSVATVTNAGLIITGGYSGEKKAVIQNVLQLKSKKPKSGKRDSFVEIVGLKLGRFRHSCCFQEKTELLICSGGMAKESRNKKSKAIDSVVVLKTEENLGQNKFEFHSTLPEPLYDHFMVIGDDDLLYILGGNNGKLHPPVNRILRFDEELKIWEVLSEELPVQIMSASGVGRFVRTENSILEFNNNLNMTLLIDDLEERNFHSSVIIPSNWLN